MGKNKKCKDVDQVQKQNGIVETDNQIQEIPEDFLTSDDFCMVQKKRGSKNENCMSRSRCNSEKKSAKDEESKCHKNFWNIKSTETVNIPISVDSNDSDSNLEDISPQSSYNSNYSIESNLSVDAEYFVKDVKIKLENQVINPKCENGQNMEFNNLKPEESFADVSVEALVEKEKSTENLETEKRTLNKKRNKKKAIKKKSVDDEIENILKEIESEQKKLVSSGKSSQCDFIKQEIANGKCDISESATNVTSIKIDNLNYEGIDKLQTASENVHVKSFSQKKKRGKAKRKRIDTDITENSEMLESDQLQAKENIANNKSAKNSGNSEMKCKTRPTKKQLSMIHEALNRAKEEEERLRKEAEMRQKMAEEAEKIRQEKLRLEQEKKEKKKLKEKKRKDKMKAEGRFLSKSQKQSRARMEATLAALREQGVDVPQICDKKTNVPHGPRLGNCKDLRRKRLDSCQSAHSSDSAIVVSERQKFESFSSQESSGKDSLSDFPSSFDLTEDSNLTPEFDRGNFSFSEEPDAVEVNCIPNNYRNESEQLHIKNKTSENQEHTLTCDKGSTPEKLRSPVVCVLGHVDTGKTKILDFIRKTHVQDSEAGGITQQIGATMIPRDALKEKCKMVKDFSSFNLKIPGLLVIDTPGHESFSNLRSRGSSICDIAILVVDIMHGLEPQTIESINLLKKGKIPFVVALNKIDRIYGWKSSKDEDIEATIFNQSPTTQAQFKKRCQEIILQFANQCLNAALYYENKDPRVYVSMVPTSAITGDGMGNILGVVAQLTQTIMQKKLIYSEELQAVVLEVKAIPGLGTTIDVILINGCLHEGDTIVLAGQEGPIVTQIRSLLMPQSLKELRVKNPYTEYKFVEGAQGVKITGKDLEKSFAGVPLLVASNHQMIEVHKNEINLFHDTINSIKTSERGVYVQASTLGSLEALLEFLQKSEIPYFNVKIGPVVKKDVMKASIMLEHDATYAVILAFDVKIERDAQELADSLGVHIFHADIIYHLFDMYMKYKEDLLLKHQEEIKRLAVFPCKLKILPEFVFSVKDPIVLGVHVEAGTLKEGTPLCVPTRDILEVGTVSYIEVNNSKTNCAKKGQDVCITVSPKVGDTPKTYGKHFSDEDILVSRITRQSIDTCKEHFRSELGSNDWHLMVELKKLLHIM